MDGLGVVNAMFLSHVIQEVEEESDSNRRSSFGAQDCHKDIIDKLLQCPLQKERQVERGEERETRKEVVVLCVTFTDSIMVR